MRRTLLLLLALPARCTSRRARADAALLAFLEEKIASLGTAACPPYHLAIVIGGLSAEMTLKTVRDHSPPPSSDKAL